MNAPFRAFSEPSRKCGLEITPALQHLIAKHRANGTAKFQDFVQVVQPHFAKIDREYAATIAQQQQQSQRASKPGRNGARADQASYDAASANYTSTQGGPLATQTHGDILTWSEQSSGLEERSKKMVGGKMLGTGKGRSPSRKHLQENARVLLGKGILPGSVQQRVPARRRRTTTL